MGLLSAAIFQGAGQGLNALSQGMFRQVEREAEDDIWQKRTRLLSEIQRENAKVVREDQAAFDDSRLPTKLAQEGQLVAARGDAQQAADLSRLNNTQLQDAIKRAEAEKNAAALETLRKEARIRGDEQIRVAGASAAASERARTAAESKRENPLLAIARRYKEATGLDLPKETIKRMADASLGLTKEDNKFATEAFKAVAKKYKTGEITADQYGSEVNTILTSVQAAPQTETRKREVSQARERGLISEAVAELRQMNYSDEKILGLGVTASELKAAGAAQTPGKAATPAQRSAPASQGQPVDRIGNQPIGMLTRQADIEESARAGNRRAIEYLERQRRGRLETETAPRDTASMMNG